MFIIFINRYIAFLVFLKRGTNIYNCENEGKPNDTPTIVEKHISTGFLFSSPKLAVSSPYVFCFECKNIYLTISCLGNSLSRTYRCSSSNAYRFGHCP